MTSSCKIKYWHRYEYGYISIRASSEKGATTRRIPGETYFTLRKPLPYLKSLYTEMRKELLCLT